MMAPVPQPANTYSGDVGAKLTELTGEEFSTQKVSALCRAAVNAGKANVEEVKVPGKGKLKGYTRA